MATYLAKIMFGAHQSPISRFNQNRAQLMGSKCFRCKISAIMLFPFRYRYQTNIYSIKYLLIINDYWMLRQIYDRKIGTTTTQTIHKTKRKWRKINCRMIDFSAVIQYSWQSERERLPLIYVTTHAKKSWISININDKTALHRPSIFMRRFHRSGTFVWSFRMEKNPISLRIDCELYILELSTATTTTATRLEQYVSVRTNWVITFGWKRDVWLWL